MSVSQFISGEEHVGSFYAVDAGNIARVYWFTHNRLPPHRFPASAIRLIDPPPLPQRAERASLYRA